VKIRKNDFVVTIELQKGKSWLDGNSKPFQSMFNIMNTQRTEGDKKKKI